MKRNHCLLTLLLVALTTTLARADEEKVDKKQAEREAAFAKMLTGKTLHGFFTVSSEIKGDKPPRLRGERYDLEEVKKIAENRWMFKTRIRYGDHDVTLPLVLPVEWAGDTPMVVVENVGFPGLGTYSARVLFHKDHYAGHWSGAKHGGHLFGTIEPQKSKDKEAESEETESP